MISENPFSLSSRVALVTGSSRGLGKAMAMALDQAGAKVALNYCNNKTKAEQSFSWPATLPPSSRDRICV